MTLQTHVSYPEMTSDFLTSQVGPLFDQSQRYLDCVKTHGSPLYLVE